MGKRKSGQKFGMYKQEIRINLYLNAVLLYRKEKIKTKKQSEHRHLNYESSISRHSAELCYHRIGSGGEGKGVKGRQPTGHCRLPRGGEGGGEEGRAAVYIGVFIEMWRRRCMEVFED